MTRTRKTSSRKRICGHSGSLAASEEVRRAHGCSRSCATRATPGYNKIGRSSPLQNLMKNSRSEERRVGKECRFGWWAYHLKKKDRNNVGRRDNCYYMSIELYEFSWQ